MIFLGELVWYLPNIFRVYINYCRYNSRLIVELCDIMKKINLKISGLMITGIIIIISFFYAINIQPVVTGNSSWYRTYAGLNNFNSHDEFVAFLDNYSLDYYAWCYDYISPSERMVSTPMGSKNNIFVDIEDHGKTIDYSKTNIQVKDVDEPDVVKTDGTYLYILSNSKIYVVWAYPAEDAEVLSIISFDDKNILNFFINKNSLIVFGTSYRYPTEFEEIKNKYEYIPYYWGISTTTIDIYDLADKENPKLIKDIELDGSFFNARMIGDFIYIIASEYTRNFYYNINGNKTINMPEIRVNDKTRCISFEDIYYINDTKKIDSMTHIISIDIYGDKIDQKSYLLGSSQNMYVSNNNIYLACQEYYYNLFWESDYTYEQATIIHRISIENGEIFYKAKGMVPGYTLNQFSMDEHNGFFRIATQRWDYELGSTTNLYILDEKMNLTSKIEGIAPGERMHSARFIGNKAYLVTFKKVDPFFTLEISDPYDAKIIGELKIPGYSDYLHPFDENHIIGIGKDTLEPQEEFSWTRDFAWYQGLKIALFDVSDFDNPKEISRVIIGDRGTDSPALYDHKSFLFDRERQLLVLPVSLYEISDYDKKQNNGYTGSIYGTFKFQGAFVYKINPVDGFEFIGKITHINETENPNNYYWRWHSYSSHITRTLFIDDILYTISNDLVKMNNLNDLSEINSINLD